MCYVAGNGAVVGLRIVFSLLRIDFQIRFVGKVFILLPWVIPLNSPLGFPCIMKRDLKSNFNKAEMGWERCFFPNSASDCFWESDGKGLKCGWFITRSLRAWGNTSCP